MSALGELFKVLIEAGATLLKGAPRKAPSRRFHIDPVPTVAELNAEADAEEHLAKLRGK